MSHVTSLKCRVYDIETLEASLPEDMELRHKKTHAWWGRFEGDSIPPAGYDPKDYGKCEYAIGFKGVTPRNGPAGPWEIGVYKAPDGDGYELLADTFGAAGQRICAPVPGIRQRYAAATVEKKALAKLSRHGWRATRETLPDGRLRVKVVKR